MTYVGHICLFFRTLRKIYSESVFSLKYTGTEGTNQPDSSLLYLTFKNGLKTVFGQFLSNW